MSRLKKALIVIGLSAAATAGETTLELLEKYGMASIPAPFNVFVVTAAASGVAALKVQRDKDRKHIEELQTQLKMLETHR